VFAVPNCHTITARAMQMARDGWKVAGGIVLAAADTAAAGSRL